MARADSSGTIAAGRITSVTTPSSYISVMKISLSSDMTTSLPSHGSACADTPLRRRSCGAVPHALGTVPRGTQARAASWAVRVSPGRPTARVTECTRSITFREEPAMRLVPAWRERLSWLHVRNVLERLV